VHICHTFAWWNPVTSTAAKPVRKQDQLTLVRKTPKEGTVSQTVVERTAEHIAESAHQASRAGSAVAHAIEEGVGVARRAAKQGGDAAEEFLNDTTQRFERHLALAVATTFAVGLNAGTLIGWMMKRK
jgi:hypothetical protein